MKKCPQCQKIYSDETLKFCLEDGSRLVAEEISGAEPPTVAFGGQTRQFIPEETKETFHSDKTTRESTTPALNFQTPNWDQGKQTGVTSTPSKSGGAKILVGVIAALLVLILVFGVGIGALVYFANQKSDVATEPKSKEEDDSDNDFDDDDPEEKKKEDDSDKRKIKKRVNILPKTETDASKGEVPSEEALQDLVKETLLDFNDAINKGDFSDFYENISETWQNQITPKDLDKGFSQFIKEKPDFSVIRSTKAEFTRKPRVTRRGGTTFLEIKGRYKISPRTMNFELQYVPQKKEWKLFGIRVSTL